MAARRLGKRRIVDGERFDLGCPAGAGQHIDSDASCMCANQAGKTGAAGSRSGGQHGNMTFGRCGGSRFDPGFDSDDGNVGQRGA